MKLYITSYNKLYTLVRYEVVYTDRYKLYTLIDNLLSISYIHL